MPSAVISKITYDAGTQILHIQYASGKVYDYQSVPQHVYEDLKSAFAKGRYLNQYVRNKYEYETRSNGTGSSRMA
jgi:hypothetical protein